MGPLEAAVGVADVIRHEVTLFDPAFLLQRQPAKHLPEADRADRTTIDPSGAQQCPRSHLRRH